MSDKEEIQNGNQAQTPTSDQPVVNHVSRPPESAKPRPDPSFGEITEGESGASLWQTLKKAISQ